MQYVHQLCAQEDGTKKECIRALEKYYEKGNVLMIGDAPGDLDAAHSNGALFYPIRPGEEMQSWKEFTNTYLDEFLAGTYAQSEEACITRFDACLPVLPPWKR